MADDHTLRSYRSNQPYRRGAEGSRDEQPARANDPLAELARLIGQSDPFEEFGRRSSRQPQRRLDAAPPPGGEDDRRYTHPPAQRYGSNGARDAEAARRNIALTPAHEPRVPSRSADTRAYHEDARLGAERSLPQYPDHHMHAGQHHGEPADDYDQDDAPLTPEEEAMYDDAPQTRRQGGLATVLALIGCAMLGTAAAYAYRSYYSHPNGAQAPPVITADNSTPTKIVPTAAVDPQSNRIIEPQRGTGSKEQVVSKQEEPLALKELGTQAAPRVVLPAPVAPAPAAPAPWGSAPAPAGLGAPAVGSNEPKKVRTVTIRPDANDTSGRPVGTVPATASQSPASAHARQVTPPAPRAPAREGEGAASFDSQSWPSDSGGAPAGRARTAAAPPPPSRTAPDNGASAGGFVVQLSSQKTEGDARSSFRSLQAKFPNELGDRQPIIRRADLGSKGVYYRTMVGPFASVQEASRFCASYKAAGGQCVVPSN